MFQSALLIAMEIQIEPRQKSSKHVSQHMIVGQESILKHLQG